MGRLWASVPSPEKKRPWGLQGVVVNMTVGFCSGAGALAAVGV